MKQRPIFQWIIKDHQEFSFDRFEITDTYHATKEDVLEYYPNLRECRSIVGKYNPSKVSVEWLVEKILSVQNMKREKHENKNDND